MMTAFLWHFLIGFVVSFAGSLPLGTVNLAVIQTSININFRAGFYLALGATIIELIYSAIAIKFIALLLNNSTLELAIQMACIPAFAILGYIYYTKQEKEKNEAKDVKKRTSFFNGLFIGLVNPLQIPFWIAYGSYLLSGNYIQNDPILLDTFIIGICSGTIVVLTLLALLSRKIIAAVSVQTQYVNKAIGIILFILTAYQIYKVLPHFI